MTATRAERIRALTAREFMNKAMAQPIGGSYVIELASRQSAENFRRACYGVRARERQKMDRLHLGKPDYFTNCVYDAIQFDLQPSEKGWRVIARHIDFLLEHTPHGPLSPEATEDLLQGKEVALSEETCSNCGSSLPKGCDGKLAHEPDCALNQEAGVLVTTETPYQSAGER